MQLTANWTGPYGGVPAVDQVDITAFADAMELAMAEHRDEIERIATHPEPPTFANTIEALERAGATRHRVKAVYDLYCSNHSTPELRAVKRQLAPLLTAHTDRIHQDRRLVDRIEPLLRDAHTLDTEQQRLLEVLHRRFVRAGAHLDAAGRERLSAINGELATLFTTFDDNILHDEEQVIVFLDATQLAGLPSSWLEGAASAAAERGRPGTWAVLNTRSSAQPFLESSEVRSLREQVHKAFCARGDHPGEHDNNPLITQILQLRTERAKLLGYPTAAHMLLTESMAATPERAQVLLDQVWLAAKVKYQAECEAMQAWAARNGQPTELLPWDVRYYAEQVRAETHAIDTDRLAQHLTVDRLRDGLFWMADQLFGWRFSPAPAVPVPHPDVTAWQVEDQDGVRGVWVFDPFARVGKRSGAWMTAWRVQQHLDEPVLPIVSNNENYVQAPAGQPTRLSWDDAKTLFHEFGHAMHGLASRVRYPALAGTSVCRDFVEFPSQLAEHWLDTPELLQRFALDDAGQPLPTELLAKLKTAANSSSGFATVEFTACALVDLALHLETEPIDPRTYAATKLAELGMPTTIGMRHHLPHFSHLFSSDGYAAAYYSYLWADVLVADAAEAFAEHGFYDRTLASRYHDTVLSRGNTVDPAEAYRAFLGRDPNPDALLRDRGFVR